MLIPATKIESNSTSVSSNLNRELTHCRMFKMYQIPGVKITERIPFPPDQFATKNGARPSPKGERSARGMQIIVITAGNMVDD